jgi:hypothetical protein
MSAPGLGIDPGHFFTTALDASAPPRLIVPHIHAP